jgi:hypothetical protein
MCSLAWREAPSLFSDRERAALIFTEAVTRLSEVAYPIRFGRNQLPNWRARSCTKA